MKLSGTDLRLLKVFDAVVRHGGFAAAQTELNVGPSTISNHITALEQRLGVKLCQRGRSGFKLSAKGELVFEEAQRLLRNIDDFSENVSALKGKLVGSIRLGLVDAVATDTSFRLHDAFESYLSEPNDINFEITQSSPQELQQKVLAGTLDVGIGSFPHKVGGLTYRSLHSEQHSLYCGERHRFFSLAADALNPNDLRAESVVGRGYWRDRHHADLGFSNIKAVVYEIEPQLILIRSGRFIGYLPDHFAAHWVKAGQLRCLSDHAASFSCDFDLVSKKGFSPSQGLAKFIQTVLDAHK